MSDNLTASDGETAYKLGIIHYYHMVTNEMETLEARVSYSSQEKQRLEALIKEFYELPAE